ncbi:MAG: nuclear transport factor 2 family protein [Saprospiraceae bacterium]|nr:nuclear transport factor 2 family protein [Saprospiraceae bacterium]
MKNLFLLVPIGLISLFAFTPSEVNSIREVVESYSKAGDNQDVEAIEAVLHEGFRVVWNDPGKNTVSLISKADYVQLLGAKKIGGDKRKVIIESIDISEGINANVRVVLDGEKGDFWNLLSLVKHDGKWLIAQDLVTAKFGG